MLADRRLVEKTPRQGYVVRQLNLTEIDELYDIAARSRDLHHGASVQDGHGRGDARRAQAALDPGLRGSARDDRRPGDGRREFSPGAWRARSAIGRWSRCSATSTRKIRFVSDLRHHQRERLKATCVQHLEILEAIDRRDAAKAVDASATQYRRRPHSGRERRQGGSCERPCDLRLTESGGPRRWDRMSRAASFRCAFTASFAPPLNLSVAGRRACDPAQRARPTTCRAASASPRWRTSFRSGLAAGDGGVFGATAIVLERPAGRLPFRVDCAAAQRFAAAVLPPLRGDERAVERRRGAARGAAGARGDRSARRAAARGRAAIRRDGGTFDAGRPRSRTTACRRDDVDAVRDAAARLVGLGPGLTPAGDDFLCGFLAAGLLPLRRQAGAVAAARARRRGRGGTSRPDDGNQRHLFARRDCRSACSRPLAALAEACARAPASDLDGALLLLAAVGHSSGLDAATGFFYGATVWGAQTGDSPAKRTASLRMRNAAGQTAERQLRAGDAPPSA